MSISKVNPSILFVGHGSSHTGFSRVLDSIIPHLIEEFEVHHFALNLEEPLEETPWPIYPNQNSNDVTGYFQLRKLIENIQPDIVFSLYDYWFFPSHKKALEGCKVNYKMIVYIPIEVNEVSPQLLAEHESCDCIVVFTQFAKNVLLNSLPAIKEVRPDFNPPPIIAIPHGVDSGIFFPLTNHNGIPDFEVSRKKARKILFPLDSELEDAFIVLNANRNTLRKRIDLTMRGFSEFARDKPSNVKLYLHMERHRPGLHILSYAESLGIIDRLILSLDSDDPDNKHPNVSLQKLNLIYNLCDIGINTSTNEGWGLISFEHAATGAVQIVPEHTIFKELWKDCGLLVKSRMKIRNPDGYGERTITSEKEIANCLETLYADSEYRKKMAIKAYNEATLPEYHWKNIATRFGKLFKEVLEKNQSRLINELS